MEQTTGTTSDAAATAPAASAQDQPAQPAGADPVSPDSSGFGARGRIRRRARFLRKARELAYRDLGGLVFNLHRFGQRNDQLVLAKLNLIGQIDHELRTLERALNERRPMTILREAGVTVCARCAAIHSSEDRYCPNCGLSLGRHPDLPIAGAPAPGATLTAPAAAPGPAPTAAPPSPPSATPPAHTPEPPAAGPAAATPAPAEMPGASASPTPSPPPAAAPAATAASHAGPVRPAGPPTQPYPAPAGGREEDTEIIRPPASGS